MDDIADAKELIKLAVVIERKAGGIYGKFHERFVDDSMTGYLWHLLSVEEDGHASFLETELKMLDKVPSAFGDVRVSLGEMEETLERVVEIEKTVAEKELDIKDAVCLALKLECEIVENQYAKLIDISSQALNKIFTEINRDSDHKEKLLAVAKKLGIECP